ncbi:MAG: hypothetical protein OEY89_01435 [Gammaproteobacteria bacterium]|nr:hypothetical protein [Gammaproteobacteria bacterium]
MLKKAYKLYSDKYGSRAQIIKAIEELAELQVVLAKFLNFDEDLDAISEEVADVEIMTAQLKMMFDFDKEVNEWKIHKIERMITRLNK